LDAGFADGAGLALWAGVGAGVGAGLAFAFTGAGAGFAVLDPTDGAGAGRTAAWRPHPERLSTTPAARTQADFRIPELP
jgi:hypothetical protein